MNLTRYYKELIVGMITTVIISGLTLALNALTGNPLLSLITFCTIILAMLLVSLYLFYGKEKQALGIVRIFRKNSELPTMPKTIKVAKRNIDFLGISGRSLFELDEVERLIKGKVHEGCTFRFLLLDPKSPFVDIKARDEGGVPESWRHDIKGTLGRLSEINNESKLTSIHIKFYNANPIWRLLFIDENLAYVSYYPHGHNVKYSTAFSLDSNKKMSLFDPFKLYFESIWSQSREPTDEEVASAIYP